MGHRHQYPLSVAQGLKLRLGGVALIDTTRPTRRSKGGGYGHAHIIKVHGLYRYNVA